MENKNYKWKLKSLAKGVDPLRAVSELKKIEIKYGGLTPQNIVDAASNSKSILHSLFEWNDSEAAKQYRLQQARILVNNIQIVILSNGESVNIGAYEIIKTEDGRFYKNVNVLNANEIEQVKMATIKALNELKNKLMHFDSLVPIANKLEEISDEILKI